MTGPGAAPTPPVRATEGVARLAVLDLMRTVALLRVIIFHITGFAALTLVASMPVMFFVAGALFARSMQSRNGWVVVRDRFRRILPSLFVFAAALVCLFGSLGLLTSTMSSELVGGVIVRLGLYDSARFFFPLISGEAPVGPGTPDDAVYYTWYPLWYVHMHLLLALIGPLLVAAYRRWPRTLFGILGVLWLLDAVANPGARSSLTFALFFVAGFAFTDGRLLSVPRRQMQWVAVGAALMGLALLPFGSTLNLNAWAPSLLFMGAAWVAVSIAWRDVLEMVAKGRFLRPVIAFVNRRALSIYLWHVVGIYISRRLMPVEGGLFRLSWIAIASTALTLVVVLVACVLFGWIEDLAARRSPEWWPGRSLRLRS